MINIRIFIIRPEIYIAAYVCDGAQRKGPKRKSAKIFFLILNRVKFTGESNISGLGPIRIRNRVENFVFLHASPTSARTLLQLLNVMYSVGNNNCRTFSKQRCEKTIVHLSAFDSSSYSYCVNNSQ